MSERYITMRLGIRTLRFLSRGTQRYQVASVLRDAGRPMSSTEITRVIGDVSVTAVMVGSVLQDLHRYGRIGRMPLPQRRVCDPKWAYFVITEEDGENETVSDNTLAERIKEASRERSRLLSADPKPVQEVRVTDLYLSEWKRIRRRCRLGREPRGIAARVVASAPVYAEGSD